MADIGKATRWSIKKFTPQGAYLDVEGSEVLLPNRYLNEEWRVGDEVDVYLYHDSESRLIAITEKPYFEVGEIAYLKVVGANASGAFVDMGWPKDLFVPKKLQRDRLVEGQYYFFRLMIDEVTGRLVGTQYYKDSIAEEGYQVDTKNPVTILVHRKTTIGLEVIVNQKYWGLMYYDDLVGDYKIGQKLEGFVKNVRDDGKLDIMPGKKGYKRVGDFSEQLEQALIQADGFLPFNDDSDSEAIRKRFDVSKKVFKMAVGKLLRTQKITISPSGLHLKKKN